MSKKKNKPRADGLIRSRVMIGRDEEGKKKYKYVSGRTQKEADYKADLIRAQMRKGIDISAGDDSFDAWRDRWLALKETELTEAQYNLNKTRAMYYSELLGARKIGQVKPYELQQVINDLAAQNPYTSRPTAKGTLREIVRVAERIFRFAQENRAIDYNPATAVKVPQTAPQRKRRSLSATERVWIDETTHNAKLPAMLMMYAGLRRGEVGALLWSDIDLDAAEIHVSKSYDYKHDMLKLPKSAAGYRTVRIPAKLVDYLRSVKQDTLLVVTAAGGQMMTASAWRRLWESYLCELNVRYGNPEKRSKFDPRGVPMTIRPFTPHCLRHTFCTLMYEAGVDVLVAMHQMGHSDVKTTLSIYTHLAAEHLSKDMSKLDVFLKGVQEGCSRFG